MQPTTRAVLAAGTAIALASVLAPYPASAVADSRDAIPHSVAADAFESLTNAHDEQAAPAVPAGFAAAMGYSPVLVDGMLVHPRGDCSSPVPLPSEFETACLAHDLGYDLLRFADRAGDPLGPWARQALDRQLDERLHEACDT